VDEPEDITCEGSITIRLSASDIWNAIQEHCALYEKLKDEYS
jgi:hypothetical protein